jgi:hypothetical protein
MRPGLWGPEPRPSDERYRLRNWQLPASAATHHATVSASGIRADAATIAGGPAGSGPALAAGGLGCVPGGRIRLLASALSPAPGHSAVARAVAKTLPRTCSTVRAGRLMAAEFPQGVTPHSLSPCTLSTPLAHSAGLPRLSLAGICLSGLPPAECSPPSPIFTPENRMQISPTCSKGAKPHWICQLPHRLLVGCGIAENMRYSLIISRSRCRLALPNG